MHCIAAESLDATKYLGLTCPLVRIHKTVTAKHDGMNWTVPQLNTHSSECDKQLSGQIIRPRNEWASCMACASQGQDLTGCSSINLQVSRLTVIFSSSMTKARQIDTKTISVRWKLTDLAYFVVCRSKQCSYFQWRYARPEVTVASLRGNVSKTTWNCHNTRYSQIGAPFLFSLV